MTTTTAQPLRRPISPYARRLARERGIPLESLRGSGPSGRIVAADIDAFVAASAAPPAAVDTGRRESAVGATINLGAITQILAGFAEAGAPFSLEDVVLRAAGCALDDVPDSTRLEGAPIALEHKTGQLVFDHIRSGSLGPLRSRRLAALEAGPTRLDAPAALSIRLFAAADIRPVMMPLLPGRAMRLVLAAGEDHAECLLSFDATQVSEDVATELLVRFKSYLEQPLRLLA